jgi:hypothetical protein
MDKPRAAVNAENDGSTMSGMLTVDADAHLQKLAACMFPTPAQLPVELVRSALKRGAASVAVEVESGRLFVADDGEGITGSQWQELARALDSSGSVVDRERAIESLQSAASPGIGLLAVFVPGARSIAIENANRADSMAMRFAAGSVRLLPAAPHAPGTRITITRRRAAVDAEMKLLRELCSAVPQEISLNRRAIEKKNLLRNSLVRKEGDGGREDGQASVSVPARGDICRVWLLDQGIPWRLITSPAFQGMVFEAALETAAMPSQGTLDMLAGIADRLYHWLAEHYLSFPDHYRERIEELIFKRTMLSGDLRLADAFAPFRLWRSHLRLSLEEVRRKAERHSLYALPLAGDPGLFLDPHQEALLLTPLQKDFLLNHLGLPLVIPAAPMGTQGKMARWFSLVSRKISRVTQHWPRPRLRILEQGQTSSAERSLCRELEEYWLRLNGDGQSPHPGLRLSVVMCAGRGLRPAVWRRDAGQSTLHVRQRYPLSVLAARAVANERENAELAFAALAPRRLLTWAGR